MNIDKIKAKHIYDGGHFRDYRLKKEDVLELKYFKLWLERQSNPEQIKKEILLRDYRIVASVYIEEDNRIKEIEIDEISLTSGLPCISHTQKEDFEEIINAINRGEE